MLAASKIHGHSSNFLGNRQNFFKDQSFTFLSEENYKIQQLKNSIRKVREISALHNLKLISWFMLTKQLTLLNESSSELRSPHLRYISINKAFMSIKHLLKL